MAVAAPVHANDRCRGRGMMLLFNGGRKKRAIYWQQSVDSVKLTAVSGVCQALTLPQDHLPHTRCSIGESMTMAAKKSSSAKKAPAAKTASAPTGFNKPLTPSAHLAAVIGSEPMARTEVTKKIWEYIKGHDLQDAANKRNINADAKLKPIFGKDQVTMFEMTKLLSAHLH